MAIRHKIIGGKAYLQTEKGFATRTEAMKAAAERRSGPFGRLMIVRVIKNATGGWDVWATGNKKFYAPLKKRKAAGTKRKHAPRTKRK